MRPSIDQIFAEVSATCGVGRHFMMSKGTGSQRPLLVQARTVTALVMRDMRQMSPNEIGMELKRCRSSIVDLIKQHSSKTQVRRDVEKVTESLRLKLEQQWAQH